jgi:hypothetical protein
MLAGPRDADALEVRPFFALFALHGRFLRCFHPEMGVFPQNVWMGTKRVTIEKVIQSQKNESTKKKSWVSRLERFSQGFLWVCSLLMIAFFHRARLRRSPSRGSSF